MFRRLNEKFKEKTEGIDKGNAFFSLMVLMCNLILSYSHSVQLLQLAGMVGIFAHIGVLSIEALFFQSSWNIMQARFKGNKIGLPNILGTIMGLGLVMLSNVHYGKQFGILGIIVGATIPLGILISEAMLSKTMVEGEEKAELKEEKQVKKKARKSKSEKVEQEKKVETGLPPAVREYFKNHVEEFGKLPSIRKTMKELKMSKWHSEKSLVQYKEEVSS